MVVLQHEPEDVTPVDQEQAGETWRKLAEQVLVVLEKHPTAKLQLRMKPVYGLPELDR